MQMTRFVERSFQLESEAERDEWVSAYEEVRPSARRFDVPPLAASPLTPPFAASLLTRPPPPV